jgi:hypothetical protein
LAGSPKANYGHDSCSKLKASRVSKERTLLEINHDKPIGTFILKCHLKSFILKLQLQVGVLFVLLCFCSFEMEGAGVPR